MARKRRKLMKTSCICALLVSLSCIARAQEAAAPFDTVPVVHGAGFRQEEAAKSGSSGRVSNTVQHNVTSVGRYGHSAVYLPYKKQVLFIGGQLGTRGTFITNDILSLDMNKPYDASQNPRKMPELSTDLPPNAWAASALDAQQRVWLIGGVTEDCETDATAYFLETASTWKAIGAEGHDKGTGAGSGNRPPRRRQAQAVVLDRGTKDSSIYVFAGIAEPYTCSLETVGYLAMDAWNATAVEGVNAGGVQTVPWRMPVDERTKSLLPDGPPVSDYAAVRLQDRDGIVYIGGQDATGRLLDMGSALLYNTTTRGWTSQPISGIPPHPQMGHTATVLLDGRIVVHGGSSPAQQQNRTILHVLDVASSSSWTWLQPVLSEASLVTPARAWHTATLTDGGVIVYAYGLDTETSKTTDDLFFLSTSENLENWSWSRENPLATKTNLVVNAQVPIAAVAAGSLATPAAKALVQAASGGHFLENTSVMPYNPKASLLGAIPGGNESNDDEGNDNNSRASVSATSVETASMNTAPIVLQPSTSTTTRTSTMPTATSTESTKSTSASANTSTGRNTAASSADANADDSSSGGSTKVIAGSVTAAFILALGAGVIALWIRKRAAKKNTGKAAGQMGEIDSNGDTPPISQLLYTRAAPRRMLSLGSSVHTTRTSKRNMSGRSVSGRRRKDRGSGSGGFDALTRQEAREAVDEFGRLPPLPEQAHLYSELVPAQPVPMSRPMVAHTISSDSAMSQGSKASVASYPFLTSVPIHTSPLPDLTLAHPQTSLNGNGRSRTLLRSHSMTTSSSTGSSALDFLDFRSPKRSNTLKVLNGLATAPLPSREFEGSGDLADVGDDPFADFEEIRQDDDESNTVISNGTRMRNLDLLPPALRPNTPSRL